MRKPSLSVRSRLLIFGLCISLIPIAIITTIYYLNARHALKLQALEWLTAVAESKRLHVVSYLEKEKVHVIHFSEDRFTREGLAIIERGGTDKEKAIENLNRHLSGDARTLTADILAIMVADMDGEVLASSDSKLLGQDISNLNAFTKAKGLSLGEGYIGQPRYLSYLGKNVIFFSAPVTSTTNGDTIGVMVNANSLSSLNDIMSSRAGMGETGEVVLGRQEGDRIVFLSPLRYIHDAPLSLSVPVESVGAEPMRLALQGRSGALLAPDYRGVEAVAAYQDIPSMGWGLVAKLDKAEAFAPLKTLRLVALIVGLVSAAAVTAIGIVFATLESRPIRRLTDATERFAAGDLKQRVRVRRKDEIGILAKAFNRMAEEIIGKTRELVRAEELVNEVAAREHAEEALGESEEIYRKLMETANDAIFVADAETGILLDANKRAEEMTGLPAEQIIGMHYTKLHPQEEIERYKKGFEDAVRKGRDTSTQEVYVCHKDGRRIPVEISGSVVELGGKKVIQGIFRDVSERKLAEVVLKESEERFRSLSASAQDAIISIDDEGDVTFWNKAAEKIFGYSPGEIIGEKLHILLMPQRLREDHLRGLNRFKETGQGPVVGKTLEQTAVRKDGTEFPVELSISAVKMQGRWNAIAIVRDITGRKRVEESLLESEGRYKSLINDVVDTSAVGVFILDKDFKVVWINKAIESYFGLKREDVIGKDKRQLIKKTIYRIFEDGESFKEVVFNTYDNNTYAENFVCHVLAGGGREERWLSHWSQPITTGLYAGGRVEQYTDVTTIKQAEVERKENLEKLRKSLGGTVRALAATVEMRDPYTAGHQQRVTDLARAIATEMGCPPECVDGIRMAGILHDIGKIAVPAEILSKPGKITPSEFEIIKTHSQVGYDILKGIEFPWPIAKIVLQHQERIDGSGYPNGLKGDEIILEARILAVADVVEAMSSHRPYRAAHGVDKALEEITRNKGVLYDSDVAEACVRVFKEKGFKFKTPV